MDGFVKIEDRRCDIDEAFDFLARGFDRGIKNFPKLLLLGCRWLSRQRGAESLLDALVDRPGKFFAHPLGESGGHFDVSLVIEQGERLQRRTTPPTTQTAGGAIGSVENRERRIMRRPSPYGIDATPELISVRR